MGEQGQAPEITTWIGPCFQTVIYLSIISLILQIRQLRSRVGKWPKPKRWQEKNEHLVSRNNNVRLIKLSKHMVRSWGRLLWGAAGMEESSDTEGLTVTGPSHHTPHKVKGPHLAFMAPLYLDPTLSIYLSPLWDGTSLRLYTFYYPYLYYQHPA